MDRSPDRPGRRDDDEEHLEPFEREDRDPTVVDARVERDDTRARAMWDSATDAA